MCIEASLVPGHCCNGDLSNRLEFCRLWSSSDDSKKASINRSSCLRATGYKNVQFSILYSVNLRTRLAHAAYIASIECDWINWSTLKNGFYHKNAHKFILFCLIIHYWVHQMHNSSQQRCKPDCSHDGLLSRSCLPLWPSRVPRFVEEQMLTYWLFKEISVGLQWLIEATKTVEILEYN